MNQTVLITGTSTGLGRATARRFAAAGWNVLATMRSPGRETELAALPGVRVERLDVQDRASIDRAVARGLEHFGRIDAVINNAGFGLFGVFEQTPREKILEQLGVNLLGVMDVTRAVLPHMRASRRGVIVNISSGAGVFALPMSSLYSASKFALEGFSEGLSYELASVGITVKIVEPGGVTAGTSFGDRSGAEASHAAAIADYAPFVERAQGHYAALRASRLATADQVAGAIFAATTDGTDRLRYVATDDILPLVRARRESSEEAYIALMRGQFPAR